MHFCVLFPDFSSFSGTNWLFFASFSVKNAVYRTHFASEPPKFSKCRRSPIHILFCIVFVVFSHCIALLAAALRTNSRTAPETLPVQCHSLTAAQRASIRKAAVSSAVQCENGATTKSLASLKWTVWRQISAKMEKISAKMEKNGAKQGVQMVVRKRHF